MQISLKWVNELVRIENVNLKYLINKLTLGGFEVEEIIYIKVDNEKRVTLDISATANRSDSLSIQGISLEIAALLNKTPQISNYSTRNFIWPKKVKELSKNYLKESDCLGFIAFTIENLDSSKSPDWLKNKLICSGQVPENNFKDFQNYILLETGYPFEFYDLEKIKSKVKNSNFNLALTNGKINKEFLATNNIQYNLNDSILMVQANQFPISIAGTISNQEVVCEHCTQSILIEGSVFNAVKMRQQSRFLGLRTDRSSKYEKSLKNIYLLESCYQLISLLRISNPNLICKFHTIAQPLIQQNQTIQLTFNNIKKVLGPIKNSKKNVLEYISPEFITQALKRLKFKVKYNEVKKIWQVAIPSFRSDDIIREIDLIEEIGRLYGFDKFLNRLPKIRKIGRKDSSYQTRKKLTHCLLNLGLNELIQYSLVNEKDYIENEIKLINPLVNDYKNLRSSLLPSLLNSIQKNINQSNSILEGFEYGHVFSKDNLNNVQEIENIAGAFGGLQIKTSYSKDSTSLKWFEVKGKLEQLFEKLNLSVHWVNYEPIKEKNILHPYCTTFLYLGINKKLGVFGQINPLLAKKLNISSNIYLFEFNFELIQNQIQKNKLAVYSEYSTYPKIIKDLSFIINKDISFNQLQEVLYLNGSQFLKKINLIDEYYGVTIPKNQKSLCLEFVFQSSKTTLQNKKIESIIDHLKILLIAKFNAIIRI